MSQSEKASKKCRSESTEEHHHVEIFEWPDRFLVEAKAPDREWEKLFGVPDPDPLAPYLVDLSECDEGFCGCRDFYVNILPHNGDINHTNKTCKHIRAARRYQERHTTKPKPLPMEIRSQTSTH